MAYEMGLKPWEFDRLTPSEFAKMVKGHHKRQQDEWYRVAWLACYILAPHSKKKITPEKLLGLPLRKRAHNRVRPVIVPDVSPDAPSE